MGTGDGGWGIGEGRSLCSLLSMSHLSVCDYRLHMALIPVSVGCTCVMFVFVFMFVCMFVFMFMFVFVLGLGCVGLD